MAVKNDDIRLLLWLKGDPQSPKSMALDLGVLDRRSVIAMAQQSKAEKWMSNSF